MAFTRQEWQLCNRITSMSQHPGYNKQWAVILVNCQMMQMYGTKISGRNVITITTK